MVFWVELSETMGDVPENLKYTNEHEWIRIEGEEIIFGITDYAQDALTEVVWVELPEVGVSANAMESIASVESVKSVSEIYAPISGKVIQINDELEDSPEMINEDPYGEGWICRMEISDKNEIEKLLSHVEYSSLIGR